MIYDLIIIGAGAAGLFAAANAPVHWNTLVLEKEHAPGQKLLLAGSGQCNLTNTRPIESFLSCYGENGKGLRPVLFPFSNLALMAYFEERGLPLETRPDGKVFPASMESRQVLDFFLSRCRARGVEIRYKAAVREIRLQESPDGGRFCIIAEKNGPYLVRRVLVATGGASYPKTGSDGSFFSCLSPLGITLIPRRPALTPIFVQGYPYAALSGISFPRCAVSIGPKSGSPSIRREGSLLLTHRGFSGPLILACSRYATQGSKLTIHYLPGQSANGLRRLLLTEAAGDARQIVTLLESLTQLPHRFLEQLCQRAIGKARGKASSFSGREMGLLSKVLTADSYEISGTGGFSVAMVTAGGVALDEINLRTMESRRYPGLYFAGEVLDVDGDTGGYNLQFAFSSAMGSVRAMVGDR